MATHAVLASVPLRAVTLRRVRRLTGAALLTGAMVLPGAARAAAEETPPSAQRRFVQGGLGVMSAVPLGDFGSNVEAAGGFTLHLGIGLRDSVVSVGGEISLLLYGDEHRKVPFSPAIPDALVTVSTTNSLLLSHARIRAQPRTGRWRPYLDGLFGINYIFTRTAVGMPARADAIAATTNLGDAGLGYGAGAGFTVGFGTPPRRTRLDISVRYLAGPEADYLTEGAIHRDNGEAILDISRSRTNMVGVYFGVSWATQ